MSELGPFYPTPSGKLQKNQHAWNQIANIIFLESPAFVGWSYSTDIVVGKQSWHMYSLYLLLLHLMCIFISSPYSILSVAQNTLRRFVTP